MTQQLTSDLSESIPDCDHRCSCPNGCCSICGVQTCLIGINGCRCLIGWDYAQQCMDCRDLKNRLDDGYCVCIPNKLPPRESQEFRSGILPKLDH
jgi:hypothetical protein